MYESCSKINENACKVFKGINLLVNFIIEKYERHLSNFEHKLNMLLQ